MNIFCDSGAQCDVRHHFKRGWGFIFKCFRYTFLVKISKTSKSLKNCFYLIKSDQDQIFRAQIWPKGPYLGFGQITIVESQIFSKVQKSDFFWSDWAQNWSKRSARLIILAKTLKLAKFWDFWGLLVIFVVFDRIWEWPKIFRAALVLTKNFEKIKKYTYEASPGCPEIHCKKGKIFQDSLRHFWKNFTRKILSFLFRKSAKTDCQWLLDHKIKCPR